MSVLFLLFILVTTRFDVAKGEDEGYLCLFRTFPGNEEEKSLVKIAVGEVTEEVKGCEIIRESTLGEDSYLLFMAFLNCFVDL